MIQASRNGHHDTVHVLLKADANPNATNSDGFTALLVSCADSSHNHLLSIQLLLAAGADPFHTTPKGIDALRLIISTTQSCEALDLILTHIKSTTSPERYQEFCEQGVILSRKPERSILVDYFNEKIIPTDTEYDGITNIAEIAIKEDREIKLRAVKTIFIGPPRVGKTITLKRLVHKRGNIEKDGDSKSSGIKNPYIVNLYHNVDVSKSAIMIKDKSKWDRLKSLKSEITASLYGVQKDQSQQEQASEIKQQTPSRDRQQKPSEDTLQKPSEPQTLFEDKLQTPSEDKTHAPTEDKIQSPLEDKTQSPLETETQTPSQESEAGLDMQKIKLLIKKGHLKEVEELLQNVDEITMLYIMDLGGQPEFYEILPLLIHGPLLGLLFISLSLPLDEPFTVEYRHTKTKYSKIKYKSTYTQLEMIQQILGLLHSKTTQDGSNTTNDGTGNTTDGNSGDGNGTDAISFLIGTYFDKIKGSPGTLESKEEEIEKLLKDKVYRRCLKKAFQRGKFNYIVPVDNYSGTEEDIEELREILTEQIYDHIKKPISLPISWVIFHLMLRDEHHGLCSIDDAIELGLSCGIKSQLATLQMAIVEMAMVQMLFLFSSVHTLIK